MRGNLPKTLTTALIGGTCQLIMNHCSVKAQTVHHLRIASIRLVPKSHSQTRDTHFIVGLKHGKHLVDGRVSQLGKRIIFSPNNSLGWLNFTKNAGLILVERGTRHHLGFSPSSKLEREQQFYFDILKEAVPYLHKWIVTKSNDWRNQDAQDVRDILQALGQPIEKAPVKVQACLTAALL
jgi:hypothetical protein